MTSIASPGISTVGQFSVPVRESTGALMRLHECAGAFSYGYAELSNSAGSRRADGRHLLEGSCAGPFDQGTNVLNAPRSDSAAQRFDWLRIAAGFNALPPSRFADRDNCGNRRVCVGVADDLGKSKIAGFR